MDDLTQSRRTDRNVPWRFIGWGGALALLLLPFLAMQFTDSGVNWSAGDFIFAAIFLAIIGALFELVVSTSPNATYRLAFALALLGFLAVVWVNLAVGIVGSEHNRTNLLFFVALIIGIGGSIGARLKAEGMARAMLSTAIALLVALIIAEGGPRDETMVQPVVEAIGTLFFAVFFVASAWLFRRAACQPSSF